MRQFRLFNNNGAVYDMTGEPERAFLHTISGLGFDTDTEYVGIGYQFLEVNRKLAQATPQGILSLRGYDEYEKFMKFAQVRPLKLEYTAERNTYLMDVNIRSISKEELVEGHRLECQIVFEGLGRIYKRVTLRAEEGEGAGKIYGKSKYDYIYSDSTQGTVEVVSDSVLDSPTTIAFIGPCLNPTWTHYVDGVLCCTGKVYGEIEAGHRLVVSTQGAYKIVEVDSLGNEVADRYQDSDFSTARFVYLKHGTNKFSFVHDGANDMNVILEGYIYYESI